MWLSGRLPCMVVSGQSGCHPGCSWLPRGQNWKQPLSWGWARTCLPLSLQEPPGSHMELQAYHAMMSGVENSVENAFPSLKARLLALGELP